MTNVSFKFLFYFSNIVHIVLAFNINSAFIFIVSSREMRRDAEREKGQSVDVAFDVVWKAY